MKPWPGPETRAAVLQHPFVLAGLAVVALLGLTAGVLVVLDSLRGGGDSDPSVIVEPKSTATPGGASRTATALGVIGTTKGTTAVRSAPGNRTVTLGTIGARKEVQIDGKTTDGTWYRVIFPPNSDLHGWIDAELLDITSGDPSALVVATAEPPIIVDVPTIPPSELTPDDPTPDVTGTPEGTPTPGGLPDLVVGTTPTISGGKLFVTIINQGVGDATGDIVVAVFNPDQTALLAGATLPGFTLQAGMSIDVGTGYDVTEDQSLLLVVDPNGTIEETDNTNNQITVSIAVGNPPPATPDQPLPFETPEAPAE